MASPLAMARALAGATSTDSHYDAPRERVLARGWHVIADAFELADFTAFPCSPLEGALDEPLWDTREDGALRVLSNVCTHRGACLLEAPRATRNAHERAVAWLHARLAWDLGV